MPDLQQPWLEPYPPDASLTDIFHCFRLILGRNPHAEEWTGHAMLAGTRLAPVVASYLRSLEFSHRGLLGPPAQGEIILTRLPEFQIYSAETDGAVGRHVRDNNYELDVTAVFRRLLRPGMAVLDIGANIGYFSMLAAALVGPHGHVLAIEPNPLNARLLEASRRINGFAQVTLMQVAAGAEPGLLVLHTSHSTGTTSDLADGLDAILSAETVPAIPPDRLVSRRIDFIKIDVDGS
ncbi:MAG: FkbM family methyltransferase, partial [Pseudomonadota bacterium]|nr:FkbM family methyltransferase [Pseudomonadota bacterium]